VGRPSALSAAANAKESPMLRLIWMLIVGLVVGALARFFYPGAQAIGLFMTALLGVAGSLVGGLIAQLLRGGGRGFHPAGLILSVLGSILVLYVYLHYMH
jgi:uncharacterized membrane protein YeaQ/YmgE (transglycosylase-associated protein family)